MTDALTAMQNPKDGVQVRDTGSRSNVVDRESVLGRETKVIALTGAPCAGKSTITDIFSDIGVDTIDTGDAVRSFANAELDDPSEQEIWDWVTEKRESVGDHAPTKIAVQGHAITDGVVVVSGIRDNAEAEWLREYVGPTLVLRVYADGPTRSERYVERELDEDEDRDVISRERVHELRQELYERERQELPYPDHDVTIWNSDSVTMHELWTRLQNLVTVLQE